MADSQATPPASSGVEMGPPHPSDDLIMPLRTVHDAATSFSTDAVEWVQESTQNALIVFAVAVATIVLLHLARRGLMYLLKGTATLPPRGWRASLYRMVKNTSVFFLTVFGGWVVAQFLTMPKGVDHGIDLAFMIFGIVQIGFWVREIILIMLDRRLNRQSTSGDAPLAGALGVISWLVNVAVWSLILLLLLDNLGVNVTTLVAGLGIGGLAVGLAAQSILADLFSALSITFDRPFVRGDFIAFGDKKGTVEKVGLKTSHLRALTGELIIVSNNQLLTSIIHNHQKLQERRVVFMLSVVYDTSPAQVAAIPQMIREIVTAQDNCRFDRAHFTAFGESALNFEVVYFYVGRDYNQYMDAHQAILLRIMNSFAEKGIRFAFPTRTVQLVPAASSAVSG